MKSPTSSNLSFRLAGFLVLLAAGTGACASSSDVEPLPDTTAAAGTTVFPIACLYGEPNIRVTGRKMHLSCPEGGPAITIFCVSGPKDARVLDDGRVSADCTEERRLPERSAE
jgi:hypothetical protein